MGPQEEVFSCFIPECGSTSEDASKRFVRVPCLPKLRQLWMKAGHGLKVKVPMVDTSPMFCCEDHFDLNLDATKQWLLEDNKKSLFIKLKRGVLPHIFPSNEKSNCAEKTKRRSTEKSSVKTKLLETGRSARQQKETVKKSQNNFIKQLNKNWNVINSDKMIKDDNLLDSLNSKEKSCVETADSYKNTEGHKTERDDVKENTHRSNEKCVDELNCKNNEDCSVENSSECVKRDEPRFDSASVEVKEESESSKSTEPTGKRKTHEETPPLTQEHKAKSKESSRSTKKRKVIKEILAWIPSDPSAAPTLTPSNPLQPFIVVQAPPLQSNSDSSPVVQFPTVGGATGGPRDSIGQQLVLAVPEGCSYTVDKITNSNNKISTAPQIKSRVDSLENLLFHPKPDKSQPEGISNQPELIPQLSATEPCEVVEEHSYVLRPASEVAVSANTPTSPHEMKVGETPRPGILPAHPQPCSTCRTQAVSSNFRSSTPEALKETELELSKNLKVVLKDFKLMTQMIETLNKELGLLRADNVLLKAQNSILIEELSKANNISDDETKKLEIASEMLKRRFTPNQVTIMLSKVEDKSRVNWLESELSTANEIYSMSPQTYKFLLSNMNFPLPSISTLKRFIERRESQKAIRPVPTLNLDFDLKQNVESSVKKTIRDPDIKERLSARYLNRPLTSGNPQKIIRTVKKPLLPLKIGKEDDTVPKVIRVDLPNTSGLNSIHPVHHIIKNPPNQIKTNVTNLNRDQQKPKVVQIQRQVISKKNQNMACPPINKPIVKKTVKIIKEALEYDKNLSVNQEDIIETNVANYTNETILKDKNIVDISMPSIDSGINAQGLGHNISAQELAVMQDYHGDHSQQVTETNDGSKVIRIQMEPLQGQEGALYEEVIIHCDDPSMFDNEVVGLAFSNEDSMEANDFL